MLIPLNPQLINYCIAIVFKCLLVYFLLSVYKRLFSAVKVEKPVDKQCFILENVVGLILVLREPLLHDIRLVYAEHSRRA